MAWPSGPTYIMHADDCPPDDKPWLISKRKDLEAEVGMTKDANRKARRTLSQATCCPAWPRWKRCPVARRMRRSSLIGHLCGTLHHHLNSAPRWTHKCW